MRSLTYFIAVSQDGFIAGPNGETDRFEQGPALIDHLAEHYPETLPAPARHQLGIDAAPVHFDAVVMGRATYAIGADQGLTSPYGHLTTQLVVSRSLDPSIDPAVDVVADDPVAAVRDLRAGDGLGVWLCGGGVLAGALLDEIDELVIKRQPLVLGAGIPLFAGRYQPTTFEPTDRVTVGSVVFESFRRADEPVV
ncbi:MAG: dihydrofolate reductase family protein [Actinomycetota bacterium]